MKPSHVDVALISVEQKTVLFLLLSICVHVAVFLNYEPAIKTASQGPKPSLSPTLSFALAAAPAALQNIPPAEPEPVIKAKPVEQNTPVQKHQPTPKAKPKVKKTPTRPKPIVKKEPTANRPTPQPSPPIKKPLILDAPAKPLTPLSLTEHNKINVGEEAIRINYQSELRLWIERHKHYPRKAKIRGNEGTVLVRFKIGTDGKLVSSHIEQGSGFSVLDKAALKTLNRASPYPKPPGFMSGDTGFEISLPFTYALRR